jgi:hypothetical protein
MNFWDDACWSRQEVVLPDGRATLLLGFASDRVRLVLPGTTPEAVACPARPHDRFLAHAYLGQSVIQVAMPGVSGPGGSLKSPYDTRSGVEALVRALRPYSASGPAPPTPSKAHESRGSVPVAAYATLPGAGTAQMRAV